LIAFFLPDMLCWKEVWASVVRKEAAKKPQCHERIVQALRQREARKWLPLYKSKSDRGCTMKILTTTQKYIAKDEAYSLHDSTKSVQQIRGQKLMKGP
jgi:hypothetical protein